MNAVRAVIVKADGSLKFIVMDRDAESYRVPTWDQASARWDPDRDPLTGPRFGLTQYDKVGRLPCGLRVYAENARSRQIFFTTSYITEELLLDGRAAEIVADVARDGLRALPGRAEAVVHVEKQRLRGRGLWRLKVWGVGVPDAAVPQPADR